MIGSRYEIGDVQLAAPYQSGAGVLQCIISRIPGFRFLAFQIREPFTETARLAKATSYSRFTRPRMPRAD